MRPLYEVADVINSHWSKIHCASRYNTWQLRTLDAIRRCRTASLGGHVDLCTDCNHTSISYNSCRNRHCPKCQQVQRERWIKAREADLLPVSYYHVVFTIPEQINRLCLHEPAEVYNIIFDTAWSVIHDFGKNPKFIGALTGMISILHTWGQTLSLHPHLHCIVPAGGVNQQGKWKHSQRKGKYLFPVKDLSKVFRARFIAALRKNIPGLDRDFYNQLMTKHWVVYAKRSFSGPKHVIEYLGRYTHKIAISNHRITNIDENGVSFRYKDYRHQSAVKHMTISPDEFIRRFSLHILPKNFVRIRHYGLLSSSRKVELLPDLHQQLNSVYVNLAKKDWKQISAQYLNYHPDQCPKCKKLTMITVLNFDKRGPPDLELVTSFSKLTNTLNAQPS